jgi:putative ATP-dependent endonuclease of OLD family
MQLVSITVERYRSITKAHKIRFGRTTTLVGPNNEGKSNILRALVTAMNVLTGDRRASIHREGASVTRRATRLYNWRRDYPVNQQKSQPKGESVIILEFALTIKEVSDFRTTIGSKLNGTLLLRITLGPTAEYAITVAKQGKGSKTLSAKSSRIAWFVAQRLEFEHIAAVRTASSSEEIVRNLVERELWPLEGEPEYQAALNKIAELQEPILRRLSANIKGTLVTFLPTVRDVRVQISSDDRYRALRRSCEIMVDDGTPTLLQYKGDGVQSLTALGIMRHVSDRTSAGKSLVIAIEEPESHLHPQAIHYLYSVLKDLSVKHQVVITTHCPLFIDRVNVGNNVLVYKQKARPAKSINEIRTILGVRASDNLRHAELVLLVEGEDDRIALSSLLSAASASLATALEHGTLAVDSMGGCGNLAYKVGLIRDALCSCHVFLDDDAAGRRAFGVARTQGLVTDADVNFVRVVGLRESELEDTYDVSIYRPTIENGYRVTLTTPKFRSRKKWADRMADVFLQQGKPWDERVKAAVKDAVARAVEVDPTRALHASRRSSVDALVHALEERLQEVAVGRSSA